jgi:threonyl-tRNA synthetase
MPVITLPDGSNRSFDAPVSVMQVAEDIGPGLAKATLAGRVDGELVDASYLMIDDASLAIVTSRDDDALELFRHDAAHVMAQAVQELFPGTQVTIGPAIEEPGWVRIIRSRSLRILSPKVKRSLSIVRVTGLMSVVVRICRAPANWARHLN